MADGGSNIRAALRGMVEDESIEEFLGCCCHRLQLCLRSALIAPPQTDPSHIGACAQVVSKLRQLVTYISSQSQHRMQMLIAQLENKQKLSFQLLLSNAGQWRVVCDDEVDNEIVDDIGISNNDGRNDNNHDSDNDNNDCKIANDGASSNEEEEPSSLFLDSSNDVLLKDKVYELRKANDTRWWSLLYLMERAYKIRHALMNVCEKNRKHEHPDQTMQSLSLSK